MALTRLIRFEDHTDERGSLVALEENRDIPFEVKRVYYIFKTDPILERGFHAHYKLKQLLICVSGSVEIDVVEGKGVERKYKLDDPTVGLYIEGVVWRVMRNFSKGSVLLVLASEYYDRKDYIFEYNDFLKIADK